MFHVDIYVHNSYLWVALKLGLPALAVFVALLLVVTRRGWRGYRAAGGPRAQGLALGAFLSLLAVAVVSFVEPELTYVGATPLLVALIAVIEVVPRLAVE